jgi:hypothetical protein
MMKARRRVVSRLSLPARSLRGRPASLRTFPDGVGCLLRKRLIRRTLLEMRPAISGVEPIFLPALRERGQRGARRERLVPPVGRVSGKRSAKLVFPKRVPIGLKGWLARREIRTAVHAETERYFGRCREQKAPATMKGLRASVRTAVGSVLGPIPRVS